jgi:hypothetical protein
MFLSVQGTVVVLIRVVVLDLEDVQDMEEQVHMVQDLVEQHLQEEVQCFLMNSQFLYLEEAEEVGL